MAILQGWRWLSSSRIKMIVQTLASQLDVSWPLIFLQRTPIVNADDDEIIGRFTGQIYAADIIADDQEAVTYDAGSLEFWTNTIPNLKLGMRVGQATLNRMNRMKAGAILPTDENVLQNWEDNLAFRLVTGVRQRMNALICAMQLDAGNYNRLGIQITNATWGMPSALKVTVAIPWDTNPTTATPIADILILANETVPDAYGIHYDRITMSRKAFRYMVGTTDFASKAKILFGADFTGAYLDLHNDAAVGQPNGQAGSMAMTAIAGKLLNMEVELYDGVYFERNSAGQKIRKRVLPANQIIFSSKANDNDPNVMDLANAQVTESIVADLTNDRDLGIGGEQYGPISYYTGREDLNPPDVTAWSVARCFPRKMIPEATAVLTVGTFS